ncbi:MAG: hypothetical protein ABI091_27815, partial [Ferruginibacter sp.]
MKKILIYISFLLISSGALAQAKIGVDGNVIATGNYPVVNSEHVKGGLHDDIQTLAQRNAIPDNFRKIGMLVYVIDSLKYYYLNNGISDASWTELTLGSGGGISPTNQIQNGIISGGTVTWSGTGLTFDITALIYAKNGIIYTISAGQVTLDPSDNTYGRIDLIAADTVANGFLKITGSAGVVPITPQANPESQIALTTGILLNAGSVVPPTITSNVIYDENNVPPEWTVGSQLSITYDKTNTTMPYSGTKDILVSSYTGGTSGLLFTGTVLQTVSQDKVIKFRVKLTGAIPSNNSMRVILYNTITGVLTATTINFQNGYGFSQTNTTDYQNVSIPFSTFASFTGTQFNRLYIYFNGTNTNPFYIDKVEIQDGVPNIPPQTDYSNKLDSVTVVADTLLTTWSKGIGTVKQIFRGLKSYRISSDSSYMIFTYLNGKTDSTQISGGGGGSTPSHDTTVIKAKYPIQFSNVDSTLQFIT